MSSLKKQIQNHLGSLGGKRRVRRGKSPSPSTRVPSDAVDLDRVVGLGDLRRKNVVKALSALRGKITLRAVESRLTSGSALRFQSQVIRGPTFGIVLSVKL